MHSDDDTTGPDRLILDWLKVAAAEQLPVGVVDTRADLDRDYRFTFDRMVARLSGYVLGKRLPPHTVIRHVQVPIDWPASTWQMFKWRHATTWWLAWLVRRRPVQLTTVRTATATLTAEWKQMVTYPWQIRFPSVPRVLGSPVRCVELDVSTDVIGADWPPPPP